MTHPKDARHTDGSPSLTPERLAELRFEQKLAVLAEGHQGRDLDDDLRRVRLLHEVAHKWGDLANAIEVLRYVAGWEPVAAAAIERLDAAE